MSALTLLYLVLNKERYNKMFTMDQCMVNAWSMHAAAVSEHKNNEKMEYDIPDLRRPRPKKCPKNLMGNGRSR